MDLPEIKIEETQINSLERRGWHLWLITVLILLSLTTTIVGVHFSQFGGGNVATVASFKTYTVGLFVLVSLFCLYVLTATRTLAKLQSTLVIKEVEKAGYEAKIRMENLRFRELEEAKEKLEHQIIWRNQAEERLQHEKHHDTVTGLPNRVLFMDRLDQVLARLPWTKRILAVMSLNLDRFKRINETLGFTIGDLLLKSVAERLPAAVRPGDRPAL